MTDGTFHNLPYETISLDGVLYQVTQVVGFRNLARFENRLVIGDPSKDDDELLSTKVFSDFSGGCGVFDEREGADTGVFWDAEGVDIDHPAQLALGPYVQSFTIAGTNAFVIGESGGKVHVSFDKNIEQFDETTDTFSDTTYDLAFDPVAKGVNFHGKLWVPQGANGYETFIAGSGKTAGTAGITPVAFAVWDNKLACIETDGQLSWWNPLTAAWASPTTAILESSQIVRDLIVYYSRSDEPALYVMTTDCLWGYDDINQLFIRSNVVFPKHPDNGLGMAVWRTGETMYISAGMGVYAWTGPGGTLVPNGLDRKQGLPQDYQGRILSLVPTLNHLYALVDGSTGGTYHSLYRYNGNGWVRMWANANKTDAITWSMATGVANQARVWWGVGNKVYSIVIKRAYSNSREINRNSSGTYAQDGYLITSWFDANMPAFEKLSAYEFANVIFAEFVNGLPSAEASIQVDYQIAHEATDAYVGTWANVFAPIETFGLNYTFTNRSNYQIRFRFKLHAEGYSAATGPQAKSPILDSYVLKHMKIPTSNATFQVTFDLNYEGMGPFGRDAVTTAALLHALVTKKTLILMEHNRNQAYVRVSNEQGWDSLAEDQRKSRTFTFVQIPYPGPGVQIL